MKRKYTVYTDKGDWTIYAWSEADAADYVTKINYCRVRVTAVERAE